MTEEDKHANAKLSATGKSRKLYAVPDSSVERERILAAVKQHVDQQCLVPPLSMEELRAHATAVVDDARVAIEHIDFVTVLVSNEVWRDTIAGIPCERRILLLPQCLRTKKECPAELDEYGLICQECGRCPLGSLQSEAESLGYVVLIAEGTTVVTQLLEQGKVDAVIGVSCLSTLEKSFPYMASEAIPGIAIPLYVEGCDSTKVDLEWVYRAIRLRADGGWIGRLDLDDLKTEVRSWFAREALQEYACGKGSRAEAIALAWTAKEGKRWRPFLTVSVYKALNMTSEVVPEHVRMAAVAVECFHKASLIHDDIEDNDDFRYGDMTLHQQFGVPIALNAGDLLIGEGYRVIANCGGSTTQIQRMLAVAAEGHRSLSIGQGEELSWTHDREPPSSTAMLEVFKLKTAPAFEVALRLGAICADAGDDVCQVLKELSKSLGIAYQINDDLTDFLSAEEPDSPVEGPSILLPLAYEAADIADRNRIRDAWYAALRKGNNSTGVRQLAVDLHSGDKARQLYEHHKNEAIRALNALDNAHLKSLLRRIVGRILE
jgi:geranylgeranyl diphosphate synthase type II